MSDPTPNDYAKRIKRIRQRFGLTQKELAKSIGVSFATVNRWENNQSKPSQLSLAQIQNIYEYMLKQPKLRFLLADDAGAGKTIMTGLYIREMSARRLISRILIIPPAGLVGNWQNEMSGLFNITFNIISGSSINNNPFQSKENDLAIVSVDTLAGTKMFSLLKQPDIIPYDLVIFDEAHS